MSFESANAKCPVDGRMVFVFGSNLAGRHGKGAALDALKDHGAEYGKALGLQGKSYAIPTKDENLVPLSLEKIRGYVEEFLRFARQNPEMQFYVTRVGCGLAGYRDVDIAPMFAQASSNCLLTPEWKVILVKR